MRRTKDQMIDYIHIVDSNHLFIKLAVWLTVINGKAELDCKIVFEEELGHIKALNDKFQLEKMGIFCYD